MAVNSTQQGCGSCSVEALRDEGNTVTFCELPVPLSNSMEVHVPLDSQVSLDEQSNRQTYFKKVVENTAAFSECVDKVVDIEKGESETPRIKDETTNGNLKNEEEQMKQISFEMGDKYMQFLMNHSLVLPKLYTRDKVVAEKVLEVPRIRKYKRTTSFNSRKVVLLFSILSSLGTMILIYLTLRVKQMADDASIIHFRSE